MAGIKAEPHETQTTEDLKWKAKHIRGTAIITKSMWGRHDVLRVVERVAGYVSSVVIYCVGKEMYVLRLYFVGLLYSE